MSITCENEINNQNNIVFNETAIRKSQRISKKKHTNNNVNSHVDD